MSSLISPPPFPVPSGYHTHQRARITASHSRPMSPREQFDQMKPQETWRRIMNGGIPSEQDNKVRK